MTMTADRNKVINKQKVVAKSSHILDWFFYRISA